MTPDLKRHHNGQVLGAFEITFLSRGRELDIWHIPIAALIRAREWDAVRVKVTGAPDGFKTDLLLEACKHGPPLHIVQAITQANSHLVKGRNETDELPLHVACRNSASADVIEELVELNPDSTRAQDRLGRTPLDVVQSKKWDNNEDEQNEVIRYLRTKTFPVYFQDVTGLPNKSAFDEWAHLVPPGYKHASAIVMSLDICGLKSVECSAGYEEGNAVIQQYAEGILHQFNKAAEVSNKKFHLPIEVYRAGNKAFCVVLKFASKNVAPEIEEVWSMDLEQAVYELARFVVKDDEEPPRYFTFMRIGCCAGMVKNVTDLVKEAEELRINVRENIGLKRGEVASLTEIYERGVSNVMFSERIPIPHPKTPHALNAQAG